MCTLFGTCVASSHNSDLLCSVEELDQIPLQDSWGPLLPSHPQQPTPSPSPTSAMFLLQPHPPQSTPWTDTDLCVTASSLCAGVFGAGRRQKYMSPPTAAAPHVRGHPPGDMGYGMYSVQCVSECMCAWVRIVHVSCVWLHACISSSQCLVIPKAAPNEWITPTLFNFVHSNIVRY